MAYPRWQTAVFVVLESELGKKNENDMTDKNYTKLNF